MSRPALSWVVGGGVLPSRSMIRQNVMPMTGPVYSETSRTMWRLSAWHLLTKLIKTQERSDCVMKEAMVPIDMALRCELTIDYFQILSDLSYTYTAALSTIILILAERWISIRLTKNRNNQWKQFTHRLRFSLIKGLRWRCTNHIRAIIIAGVEAVRTSFCYMDGENPHSYSICWCWNMYVRRHSKKSVGCLT